jgi:membrane protease YdiL (CAAX protease family)
MKSMIGGALRSNKRVLWATTVLSALVVGADLTLVATRVEMALRFSLTLLVVIAFAIAASELKDGPSFGFQLSPQPGWSYWARTAPVLGMILLIVVAAGGGVMFGILRYPMPPSPITATTPLIRLFLWACVVSPLFEEPIYRLAICPTAVGWLGPKGGILVSGAIFAGLHVLYGNPSPDNLFGGFILAWAFLKSGTLIVPIALHSLGNLCILLFRVWYYYHL